MKAYAFELVVVVNRRVASGSSNEKDAVESDGIHITTTVLVANDSKADLISKNRSSGSGASAPLQTLSAIHTFDGLGLA